MMKYQDIHTTDSALWKQYQDYMAKGEYDAAKAILAQTQLDNKSIDASLFNDITTELTRLQNQGKDSTWSKNVMAVQPLVPSDMQAGECYCKIDRALNSFDGKYYLFVDSKDDSNVNILISSISSSKIKYYSGITPITGNIYLSASPYKYNNEGNVSVSSDIFVNGKSNSPDSRYSTGVSVSCNSSYTLTYDEYGTWKYIYIYAVVEDDAFNKNIKIYVIGKKR